MVLIELSHGQRHAGDARVIDQQVESLIGHQGHSIPEKSDQTQREKVLKSSQVTIS